MKDVTQVANLDQYLYPVNSPIRGAIVPDGLSPWKFGQQQGIQTKRLNLSQASVRSFQQQISGTFASGTVANGGTLTLTSTLTPSSPHATEPLFAVPYAAIYLGTSASTNSQIFPVIGTANGTMYPVLAGLDFQVFNGIAPEWRATVINNSGALATVGFNITWQYLWLNQGTVQ